MANIACDIVNKNEPAFVPIDTGTVKLEKEKTPRVQYKLFAVTNTTWPANVWPDVEDRSTYFVMRFFLISYQTFSTSCIVPSVNLTQKVDSVSYLNV